MGEIAKGGGTPRSDAIASQGEKYFFEVFGNVDAGIIGDGEDDAVEILFDGFLVMNHVAMRFAVAGGGSSGHGAVTSIGKSEFAKFGERRVLWSGHSKTSMKIGSCTV